MVNLIATIILLFITVFVIGLFPAGKDFLGNFTDVFTEKRDNVVQEFDRVKGQVDDVVNTVNETKEKVENTVDAVNSAVDSASNAVGQVNDLLGRDSKEPWRQSDPEIDPSIEAGRTNYNYADPGLEGLNEAHLYADIKPWIERGNSVGDNSTIEERIAAMALTEKGRKILDILGYHYEYKEN